MKRFSPSPEFLEACRIVLGSDDPLVVLDAIRTHDPRMAEVYETQQVIEENPLDDDE